jgi:hypothetical protein
MTERGAGPGIGLAAGAPVARGDAAMTLRRWAVGALSLAALSLTLAGCGARAAAPTTPAKPAGTVVAVTPAASAPAATPGAGGTPVSTNPAVTAAVADLAKQQNVDPSRITVASAEAVEWPDGSLGCPQPGQNYIQVITPGWRIRLGLDGKTYEYHANQAGTTVVLCQTP